MTEMLIGAHMYRKPVTAAPEEFHIGVVGVDVELEEVYKPATALPVPVVAIAIDTPMIVPDR